VALPKPFARRKADRPTLAIEQQRDDLPKTGLFAEPVRVADLQVLEPEVLEDGSHRVTFLVEVRDADGKRCSDLSVEAQVSGPERSRTVQGTTDMFGRIRFRMAGDAGTYAITVTDVAAHGLAWDREAGTTEASTTTG
jgi:hypothetical protein